MFLMKKYEVKTIYTLIVLIKRRIMFSASMHILKFNPEEYFHVCDDKRALNEDKSYVKLKQKGIQLIIQYYRDKYGFFPIQSEDIREMINYINNDAFRKAARELDEYRVAFLYTSKNGQYEHSLPFVYIQERGKETLFFADSLGGINEAVKVAIETGIPTIAINNARQNDYYSCHTDAIIFLKNIIEFDLTNNRYMIQNLLTKLESRIYTVINGISISLLPDELLTTVQLAEFLDANKGSSSNIVHRNIKNKTEETLSIFLNRHPEIMQLKSNNDPIISRYLRDKGFKYANIIEIQFYLNQLYEALNSIWSFDIHSQFILEAKLYLEKCQSKYQGNYKTGEGLYEFTKEFINRYLPQPEKTNLIVEEEQNKKRKIAPSPLKEDIDVSAEEKKSLEFTLFTTQDSPVENKIDDFERSKKSKLDK